MIKIYKLYLKNELTEYKEELKKLEKEIIVRNKTKDENYYINCYF